MQDGEIMDTHCVGTDEDSSICPLALVKAGVVHNPLSCQCERLKGSKKNKASEVFFKTLFQTIKEEKMHSTKPYN